jgi:hypothetical protein
MQYVQAWSTVVGHPSDIARNAPCRGRPKPTWISHIATGFPYPVVVFDKRCQNSPSSQCRIYFFTTVTNEGNAGGRIQLFGQFTDVAFTGPSFLGFIVRSKCGEYVYVTRVLNTLFLVGQYLNQINSCLGSSYSSSCPLKCNSSFNCLHFEIYPDMTVSPIIYVHWISYLA